MKNIQKHVELLGLPAEDKVTGFHGILTSISFDLYGCIQFVITPKANDGKIQEGAWFDAGRIRLTGKSRAMDLPPFDVNYVLDYTKGAADKPLP